ncbi:hypothetical protein K443DRAFT_14790 [Laccaria amethystina LaAM-08-1]|uniref:DUF7888 domain-containing protein n=1 Tax=Laccaria amethystina LaAM-08-1 TaxID=1095629 RepID=A0A0C9WHC7_9AGAR|nr:hypothetical protein K443DRAFT_14790 [Laccaria amethystina LaAM-08-1]
MKIVILSLGLFVFALANPLVIRHPEHAALAPLAGVVGGREIRNGDMTQRSDNSLIQVVRAVDNNIKQNSQEGLEARQIEELIGAAIDLLPYVIDFFEGLIDTANEDNSKRSNFTKDVVTQSHQKWPHYNWVICHVKYETAFDGKQNTDWGKTHQELPLSWFDMTIGYDLYWFKSGTFTRVGDGGYINWAYDGAVTSTENDGKIVHFAAHSG